MIKKRMKEYLHTINEIKRQNNELIWCNVWHDTIKGIKWCENLETLSPGRWAVGYNYLYAVTRVLTDFKPKYVLEFGLGISSSLISSYFSTFTGDEGYHDIIEQDSSWIEFYSNNRKLSNYSHIYHHKIERKEYRGIQREEYLNLPVTLKKKYDLISIDGPKGADHFSRVDILNFLPDILSERFVIVVDDSQRIGEAETIEEIKRILVNNGIKYEIGSYSGITDCTLIVSSDLKFLCSL